MSERKSYDVRIRITPEFYWWLNYYKELHGHASLAETMLAVTKIGMERINAPVKTLSPGEWGGHRKRWKKQKDQE